MAASSMAPFQYWKLPVKGLAIGFRPMFKSKELGGAEIDPRIVCRNVPSR